MNSKKWPKIVALILTLTAMVGVLSSCGDKKSSSVPKEFSGKLIEQYMELIASKNYTYETSPVDAKGNEQPIFYAKAGDTKSMLTFTIQSGGQSTPASILYNCDDEKNPKNGKYYFVFSAEGIYTMVPDNSTSLNNIASQLDKASLDYLIGDSFVEKGNVTYQGQKYQYEDYTNAKRGVRNRFLFDADGNLKYMGKVGSNGKVENVATISIYETNSSVFDDVYNYRAVDYYQLFPGDQQGASTTAASAETTTAAAQN